MSKQKELSILPIIVLILAVGLSIYLIYQKPIQIQPVNQSSSVSVDANWKTYTNSIYQYSIQYPADWTIKDIIKADADLTTLDVQMFNDDNSPTLGSKEVLVELSNNVNIDQIKQRTNGGDAGMGYSNKVTTENFQGKEMVKVINQSFSYQPNGGTKDTWTYYVIYIPVGNNFLTLEADITNKQVLDQMAATFTSSDKTAADYLPEVVKLVKADFATISGEDKSSIIVNAIQRSQWKDSSLGCPKPGKLYSQIITPGYRVLLDTGKGSVEYHTDKGTSYVKCY